MIVQIEGVDGVGKSTIVKAVAETLKARGIYTEVRKYPYHEEEKKLIELYDDQRLRQIFHTSDKMKDLDYLYSFKGYKDRVLLLDRYTLSTLVYGIYYGRLKLKWLLELIEPLPEPDYTFIVVANKIDISDWILERDGVELTRQEIEDIAIMQELYKSLAMALYDDYVVLRNVDVGEVVEAIVNEIEMEVLE